jgi:adenine deaminase
MTPEALQRRVQAAQGQIPCDLVLRNVRYLDVFSCEWRKGDIAVIDGVIVATESGLKARRFFDGQGKSVVPGFIDAHVHVESSLLVPFHFQRAVLPKGTTTAVCDPHELANVMGPQGIQYFLDSSEKMDLDLRVMLSSCVPATHLETNGGGTIPAEKLLPMASHPKALGLAEMMNMPGVLNADPEVLKKLVAFSEKRIDGHAPLLRGAKLSAYAATGISSCHESSELEEAREKLIKGIAVWIREGSVAKDLEALHSLLTLATSTSIGFCTDDRNPLDILTEGHIDHLVRETIRRGLAPEIAYRAASWSVARHYGLDRGSTRLGAIAPGYVADLVILEDAQACGIHSVLKSGQWIQELPSSSARSLPKQEYGNSMKAHAPDARDLEGPAGKVHVIGVIPGKIITDRSVADSRAPGVARLSVLERYGRGSKPANGYVRGFGAGFKGAIASSVGHDSHNLIAVGDKPEDMRVAMKALIESGGGFCVVQGGQVAAKLELPFGGLMSERDPVSLKQTLVSLKTASREAGCELPEPFLQLAFLSLPVIPSLKLTDKGLVDVDKFQVIDVRAS